MRPMPLVLALGLIALMGAQCPSSTDATAPADETERELLTAAMQDHFTGISAIRDAVIAGDLDTLPELSAVVDEREANKTYPPSWRPHVATMLSANASVASAKDLGQAAAATAKLAAACGRCHAAVGAKVEVPDEPPPSHDETIAAQMERHRWASARMWEGMILPANERWRYGTDMFSIAPGCSAQAQVEPNLSEYLEALCERVHLLGRRAADVTQTDEQAAVYGDFLQTCARCHNAGA